MLNEIIEFCHKPRTFSDILDKFSKHGKKEVKKAISTLQNDSLILQFQIRKTSVFANRKYLNVIEGRVQTTPTGNAFIIPTNRDDSERDIFVGLRDKKNAWNDDVVLVQVRTSKYSRDRKNRRKEGKIVKIVKRSNETISGKIVKTDTALLFQPKNKSIPNIKIKNLNSFEDLHNKLVGVNISSYGSEHKDPEGEIVKIYGECDTKSASITQILDTNNIKDDFPPMVLVQTKGVSTKITEDMFGDRLNLTEKQIMTIDGDYSKDFDDAISLEKNEKGNYVLGVHIADVSHYVTEGSPLDIEAFERGTSVYFANKVVPMLPFELSNGICSLNPDENRFAFSVFMEFNTNFDVMNTTFHKSVICSKYRMTYNNVNKILDNDKDLCQKYEEITDLLHEMNNIALKLEQKRYDKGYLELDIPECYIITDENDNAVDVKMRSRGASEKLIEQFMVLTNEKVAEFMEKEEIPSVYRVHEPPNTDKLKSFANIARGFGYKIKDDDVTDKKVLNKVLEKAETAHKNAMSIMILRSLSKAKYQDTNIGHDGLALENYLHFTSPIRRYPDLVVHRMLAKKLEKQKFTLSDIDFVQDASIMSTDREIKADTASRNIEKLYKAEYMTQFIGEEFEVTVSGVQNFGIFVALDNTIEGLIRKEMFSDDDYDYIEDEIKYIGTRTKKVMTIGTKFKAKLISASAHNGQIDFVPVT